MKKPGGSLVHPTPSKPGPARMVHALFFLSLFLTPTLSPAQANDPLQKSLVKIFTTMQEPNYYEPWRPNPEVSVSGSGSVLPGNRILTNAHVVSNAIFIQVLKEGDSRKYVAKREFVAHDCDLAVLKVEDPKFFEDTKPVTFGSMPFKRDKLAVYGFPIGGAELSITEGVVSRIEVSTYSHSGRSLLDVQTDAAINPGNSGGPVFKDQKMVGVAFQGYNGAVAQNTGYFVPVPLVQRFLSEIKTGSYGEIPSLGIYIQTMENDGLRESFGMKPGQAGVLVTQVIYQSSAWDNLRVNDVILSLDGYPVANDATIAFRKGERINFGYPVDFHRIGDKMKLKILRDKKPLEIVLALKKDIHLAPLTQYDVQPTYFIFDGLVFTPMNWNYPGVSKDTPTELKALYFHGLPSKDRKQVVLLSHILSAPINQGYDSKFANLIVTKVNGHTISEMKDLIQAFQDPQDGRHIIDIDKPKEVGTQVILDAAGSPEASKEILEKYDILSDRSDDLKEANP